MGTGWWFADLWHQDKVFLASWVFWVIGSICLHELSHGWMALRFGDRTPVERGHMTLSPVVHMGWMSLLVFFLVGIAWGAMPVNPSRMRGRNAPIYVALAGPGMNVALAAGCIILGGLWFGLLMPSETRLIENIATFFLVGGMLNVVLAIFNLLPVPPLDGSRVLAEVSGEYRRLLHHPNAPMFMLVGLLVLFWWGGELLFAVGSGVSRGGIGAIAGLVRLIA